MTDIEACFNCQRMMTKVELDNDEGGRDESVIIKDKMIKPDLYLCPNCGFINYKLPTEHTSFIVSWQDAAKVEDVSNTTVMYWTPPETEREEQKP